MAAAKILQAAEAIANAGTAFSAHSWRAAAARHLWGWQITRSLYLLVVLTGAVGEPGGVNLHATNKFVPKHPNPPPAPDYWNELLFPKEFPLAFFEMSFLLPHFLKEGRGKLAMYFTRVYNPVWTNPDGMTWIEVLSDEAKVERHATDVGARPARIDSRTSASRSARVSDSTGRPFTAAWRASRVRSRRYASTVVGARCRSSRRWSTICPTTRCAWSACAAVGMPPRSGSSKPCRRPSASCSTTTMASSSCS